jgi:hypothetical protein
MIADDPLSLVFIGCFVVSGMFLILSSLLGFGHGHFHIGHIGHVGDVGHVGHVGDVGHAGHAPGHASAALHHALPHAQAGTHAAQGAQTGTAGTADTQHATAGTQTSPSIWATLAGYLNLYAILTFLFWFGLIGYVLHNLTNVGSLAAFVGALLVGIIGAALITIAMRKLMGRDYGELTAESSELVGIIATVSLPIRAGGIGEIIYIKGTGGRKSIGARSVDGQAIPREAEVVIVGYEKGIAQVQTWDRFITGNDELNGFLRTQKGGNASTQITDVILSHTPEQP